jgi:hypothetical protein
LDERGKINFGTIDERGHFIFGVQDGGTTGQAYTVNLTDTVTITDAATPEFTPGPGGQAYTVNLSDAVAVADSKTKIARINKNDAVSMSDTKAKLAAKAKADAIVLGDTKTKQMGRKLADSVGVVDTANKQVAKTKTDAVNLSDSMSKRIFIAVTDAVNLGDSSQTNSQGAQTKALSDTVLITDAIVKRVISISKADAVNVGEVDSQRTAKKLLDQITATDTITKSKGKAIILTDAITVEDAIFKAANVFKADTIAMDENTTKRSQMAVTLYDVIIVADTMQTYLPNAPELIGRIRINGANLNVYINGKHEAQININGKWNGPIDIKGGIE